MVRTVILLAAGLLAGRAAWAMGAADPFTPPGRVAAGAAATQADTIAPRLTGLRLGRKPAALIDGQWVALGDAVGRARLSAVRPLRAELRHPDGRREWLALEWVPPPAAAASAAADPPSESSLAERDTR